MGNVFIMFFFYLHYPTPQMCVCSNQFNEVIMLGKHIHQKRTKLV